MRLSGQQPEYLPWLGFFDKLSKCDVFVITDSLQFKRHNFQNRNRIKNRKGWQWLTVPVIHNFPQTIKDVKIDNTVNWRRAHLDAIIQNYSKSPYYEEYIHFVKGVYSKHWENLADLDIHFIENLARLLNIKTPLKKLSELGVSGVKSQLIIELCKKLNADEVLLGLGSKNYIDKEAELEFRKNGIKVYYREYRHPIYNQMFPETGFQKYMSVLDLLFNEGPESLNVIKKGSVIFSSEK